MMTKSKGASLIASQPWKLTQLLWSLLVSALLPTRLCELLPKIGAVADTLDAFDSKQRPRQVDQFRLEVLALRRAA